MLLFMLQLMLDVMPACSYIFHFIVPGLFCIRNFVLCPINNKQVQRISTSRDAAETSMQTLAETENRESSREVRAGYLRGLRDLRVDDDDDADDDVQQLKPSENVSTKSRPHAEVLPKRRFPWR